MTVSVIIPCYKQAHLVGEAVRSVIAQTRAAHEIIIVDDGSPDDVPTAVAPFGDRVKLIRQSNAGLSAARNTGLAAATGELCLFLDADDWLAPEALQRHAEVRAATHADVTVSGWREITADGSIQYERLEPILSDDLLHGLLASNLAVVHCFVVPRRAVLDLGGFESTLRSCEDWDLWIRLAAAGLRFAIVPGALALYRRAPVSMSRNLERMYDSAVIVIERNGHLHGDCPLCDHARTAAIDYWADNYFRWDISPALANARDWCEFFTVLRRAITRVRQHPQLIGQLLKAIGRAVRS